MTAALRFQAMTLGPLGCLDRRSPPVKFVLFWGGTRARLLQEVSQRNIIVSIVTFFISQWVDGRVVASEPLIHTRPQMIGVLNFWKWRQTPVQVYLSREGQKHTSYEICASVKSTPTNKYHIDFGWFEALNTMYIHQYTFHPLQCFSQRQFLCRHPRRIFRSEVVETKLTPLLQRLNLALKKGVHY
jgi:hypothetical protein